MMPPVALVRHPTSRLIAVLLTAALVACSNGGGGSQGDATAPTVSKTAPNTTLAITPTDPIVITFSEAVAAASVALGGDLGPESDGGILTTTTQPKPAAGIDAASDPSGDTLTISPQSAGWGDGNDRTLTVDADDLAGNAMATLHLSFSVVQGMVYVRPSPEGNDVNDGTLEAPKATIPAAIAEAVSQMYDPGAVLVSEGSYLVDSGLGAPTHVVLAEGISLFGGYAADFSERDPATHTSTIEDVSTTGGGVANPRRTIESGNTITAATAVDGFTIQATQVGTANVLTAVFNNGGSPTIQHDTINGGAGTGISIGVYNANGAAPLIQQNAIHGGTITDGAGSTNGIMSSGAVSETIQHNIIDAGGGGDLSWGIVLSSVSSIVRNNTITGGMGTTQNAAILSIDSNLAVIDSNTIMGGENLAASFGIQTNNAQSMTIRNNTIWGGSGLVTFSIRNFASSPTIQNNTIHGGAGVNGSYGIFNMGNDTASVSANPAIQNNIISAFAGSGQRYCVYEQNSLSNPVSVENNDLFDCPAALYHDDPASDLQTMEAVNNLTGAAANVSIDPVVVDADGADNDLDTLADNDWHLSASSPPEVTQGGLNLATDFDTDKDGTPRTAPWSMGAYEKD